MLYFCKNLLIAASNIDFKTFIFLKIPQSDTIS